MIRTGLESLLADRLPELKGRRVGVVANHASVTSGLVHISDALCEAGVTVAAMFGPEHGVRGDLAAGAYVQDSVDRRLQVPVHSLYGARKRPDASALQSLDLMLIDLQDVGARFYTFIYTMGEVMTACGERGTPVWVLDRPNPIGGIVREGPTSQPDFSYASFQGSYPLPIRHGLAIGEIARYFTECCGVKCELRVIPMQGWDRAMFYNQTGLAWVMPSPNMPTLDTALVYPGLCLIEGTNISCGRGTTKPFETIGAPWIDAYALRKAVEQCDLPGVAFREAFFVPWTAKFEGEQCAGLQLHVTDREAFRPVLTGITIISEVMKLHPEEFEFKPASDGPTHFDILCGTDAVRKSLESGVSPQMIASSWEPALSAFESTIASIRLY